MIKKNELVQLLMESLLSGQKLEHLTAEDKRLYDIYRMMPVREYESQDPIIPTSLVQLECGLRRSYCYIVPYGGGKILSMDGVPIQVVTPDSPLGGQLLGKKTGDTFHLVIQNLSQNLDQNLGQTLVQGPSTNLKQYKILKSY